MSSFDVETFRSELLAIRSRCDSVLASLPPSPATESGANPVAIYMTSTEFAEYRHCSPKTIARYCAIGMPHSGTGHARRIPTKDAVAWLEDGGQQKAARLGGMAAR